MRESTIEDYLSACVRQLGGDTRKLAWIGRSDAPDRYVMLPHRVHKAAKQLLVEVKRPGEAPRPSQLREHERLRRFGVRVEVVDSFEAVDALIKELA